MRKVKDLYPTVFTRIIGIATASRRKRLTPEIAFQAIENITLKIWLGLILIKWFRKCVGNEAEEIDRFLEETGIHLYPLVFFNKLW
jgi:hypothetical protein